MTAAPSFEKLWCAVKHSLALEGHLEECMANSARHVNGEEDIGLTSRGETEELWAAIKHQIHREGHLEEAMSKMNDEEMIVKLAKMLDEVRAQRQELVKMAGEKEGVMDNSDTCERCKLDLNGPTEDCVTNYAIWNTVSFDMYDAPYVKLNAEQQELVAKEIEILKREEEEEARWKN